jgi:hypothetical protein
VKEHLDATTRTEEPVTYERVEVALEVLQYFDVLLAKVADAVQGEVFEYDQKPTATLWV